MCVVEGGCAGEGATASEAAAWQAGTAGTLLMGGRSTNSCRAGASLHLRLRGHSSSASCRLMHTRSERAPAGITDAAHSAQSWRQRAACPCPCNAQRSAVPPPARRLSCRLRCVAAKEAARTRRPRHAACLACTSRRRDSYSPVTHAAPRKRALSPRLGDARPSSSRACSSSVAAADAATALASAQRSANRLLQQLLRSAAFAMKRCCAQPAQATKPSRVEHARRAGDQRRARVEFLPAARFRTLALGRAAERPHHGGSGTQQRSISAAGR